MKTIEEQKEDIFLEYKKIGKVCRIGSIDEFNQAIADGQAGIIVAVSEALQEKKIVHLTDAIRKREARLVLIAGPSSSGKTTFSKRLALQLMACGLNPHIISLDDYYVDRECTPLDDKGEYDYESLYALDLDYYNEQLQQLMKGERVELPRYDFPTGKSIRRTGNFLQLGSDDVLIMEGIHALNPELTKDVTDKSAIYKIFVSPMTGLLQGSVNGKHIYTAPVDNRLLRRIIRDVKQRNSSAQDTIHRWASVRAGEEKWIYPYLEEADRIFNTALYYELAVIKSQAEEQLEKVPADCEEYAEAQRLLSFIRQISPLEDTDIPSTSLLREFLGGSWFA